MATPTYTPIASITLGSSASSVEFSSIPQDYRDLVLVHEGGAPQLGTLNYRLNNDSNSIYTRVFMDGNTSVISQNKSTDTYFRVGLLDTQGSQNIFNLMDYSKNDRFKNSITRAASFSTSEIDPRARMSGGIYRNTSIITSIQLIPQHGPFNSGTTFSLWGVAG